MVESVKQVIVVRKDLKMRKGKLAAQVAHASLGAILKLMDKRTVHTLEFDGPIPHYEYILKFDVDTPLDKWLNGIFTKIVVYVESEEELLKLTDEVSAAKLPFCLITDAGKTEFHGQPTVTCLAIGPSFATKIDTITGKLPLM
jgi:peptidyl-tRNA hydrolase, PTH2 family